MHLIEQSDHRSVSLMPNNPLWLGVWESADAAVFVSGISEMSEVRAECNWLRRLDNLLRIHFPFSVLHTFWSHTISNITPIQTCLWSPSIWGKRSEISRTIFSNTILSLRILGESPLPRRSFDYSIFISLQSNIFLSIWIEMDGTCTCRCKCFKEFLASLSTSDHLHSASGDVTVSREFI